jgi:dCTP deaminase
MLTASKIIEEVNNGKIFISDFDKNKINPNSYNVTLNKKLLVYTSSILSTTQPNETKEIIIPEEGYVLKAGEFYLGATNEVIGTDYYVPKIDGRSSLG